MGTLSRQLDSARLVVAVLAQAARVVFRGNMRAGCYLFLDLARVVLFGTYLGNDRFLFPLLSDLVLNFVLAAACLEQAWLLVIRSHFNSRDR